RGAHMDLVLDELARSREGEFESADHAEGDVPARPQAVEAALVEVLGRIEAHPRIAPGLDGPVLHTEPMERHRLARDAEDRLFLVVIVLDPGAVVRDELPAVRL